LLVSAGVVVICCLYSARAYPQNQNEFEVYNLTSVDMVQVRVDLDIGTVELGPAPAHGGHVKGHLPIGASGSFRVTYVLAEGREGGRR
jgi:hypothetical protein